MDPRRILLFIVIGLIAAYAWYRYDQNRGRRIPETFTPATAPKLNIEDVKVLAALDAEYTKLVDAVVPSVVSITSSGRVALPPTIEDLLLQRQRTARASSLGSGVIVSKEGHILTNFHVIQGGSEFRVQLTDGRNVPATLIGGDKATDIAILHVAEKNLEPLPLGDSDQLRVGQQVFAIGNPYGLEESVSMGIVSAKGRRQSTDTGVEFIQHDAAVNQGNSGGPLLNLRGEVVGINSQILSVTGGAWQGISFAIPSNTARRIMDSIIKRGRALRPYLGVSTQMLHPALVRNFGLPDTVGAMVTEVGANSPAAQAGLRPGDVVRSMGGKKIRDPLELRRTISESPVGEGIELVIIRNGAEQRVTVKLIEVPPQLGRAGEP